MLKYFGKNLLEKKMSGSNLLTKYPGDGIKTAKEIANGIQKLFNQYQEMYAENYNEIRTILLQGKDISININIPQIDKSLHQLEELYTNSKEADILNLRMNTLLDRLRILILTEQQAE